MVTLNERFATRTHKIEKILTSRKAGNFTIRKDGLLLIQPFCGSVIFFSGGGFAFSTTLDRILEKVTGPTYQIFHPILPAREKL